MAKGKIGWLSSVARALMKAKAGAANSLHTPSGDDEIKVLEILYSVGWLGALMRLTASGERDEEKVNLRSFG